MQLKHLFFSCVMNIAPLDFTNYCKLNVWVLFSSTKLKTYVIFHIELNISYLSCNRYKERLIQLELKFKDATYFRQIVLLLYRNSDS